MPYRRLDPDAIIRTINRLSKRVAERFPGRGLAAVASDLADLAAEEVGLAEKLTRPRLALRALLTLVMLSGLGAIIYVGWTYGFADPQKTLTTFEGLEALINIVLLSGAGMFFLLSFETRTKRGAVLKRIDQLRSIAHVIDMHQLTKDPTLDLFGSSDTPSSPERDLHGFEMVRYLDYCAEMLALTGKLAAVYLEYIKDPVVIATVNDFETLTSDLARKVWQKISVIEPAVAARDTGGGQNTERASEPVSSPVSTSNPLGLPKILT